MVSAKRLRCVDGEWEWVEVRRGVPRGGVRGRLRIADGAESGFARESVRAEEFSRMEDSYCELSGKGLISEELVSDG